MLSPYMLPPGPERRALMLEQSIRPCLLDYSDDEWCNLVADVAGAVRALSRPDR